MTSPLGRVLVAPVRAYQRWISPGLPPRCRFYPTCSEYAVQAVERHGVLVGPVLALWRLLRCNPWNFGGIDHVPERTLGDRLRAVRRGQEPAQPAEPAESPVPTPHPTHQPRPVAAAGKTSRLP